MSDVGPRVLRRIVWSLWAASLAALVGAHGLSPSFHVPRAAGAFGFVMLVWASVGVLLCLRVPRNPIGWLFLGIGMLSNVGALLDAYAAPAHGLPASSVAAVGAGLLGPLPLVILPALLVLFPDGRLPSRRWRLVGIVWIVVTATYVLSALVWPGRLGLSSEPALENPIGSGGDVG